MENNINQVKDSMTNGQWSQAYRQFKNLCEWNRTELITQLSSENPSQLAWLANKLNDELFKLELSYTEIA